jgi:uncharacterized membrane protein YsdA (DUF1294 family)
LALLLCLVRPLQKNAFFILYFALVIGAAALTEEFFFRVTPFAYKTFLLFIPYHLAMINLATFVAYGFDKRAAVKGNWRVPEMQLHTLEFLGGWPGAFLAQKIFRHKTKKKSFQSMFWLMLVLQIALVWYILSFLKIIKSGF